MSTGVQTPAQRLATPLQFIKGIGPQKAELLAGLGLFTARDVLFHFPRDYQDLSKLRPVARLVDGEPASVVGRVEEFELRGTAKGGSVLGVLVRDPTGALRCLWFNQNYMLDRFRQGQRVLVTGKTKRHGLVWEMSHPSVQWLDDDEEPSAAGVLPVYPLCEGVTQGLVRKAAEGALASHAEVLDEVLPEPFLAAHNLLPIRQALPKLHFPEDRDALAKARRRFAYQELFVWQLALALKRAQRREQPSPQLEATAKIDSRIRRLFPYELTAGQQQAIADVAEDMNRPVAMNRLLQGDVGSGKTAVALYAILLCVAHGHQAVLMAPTEILARQHERTLAKLLAAAKVRVAVLSGGLPAAERQWLLARLKAGEIDVVIGTQAVLQGDVEFARLGLVVIDEQHKFGVRQRAALRQAALSPHYLVMTATPIPRTVGLTLYGDLDVSTLRDHPPGRQRVNTYWARPDQRGAWWEFFRKKLREGRQGYVIAPLVEESEQVAAASQQQLFESLSNGELEAFRLGQLHGRMTSAEKEVAMADFREGRTQVLVSTTVVEVGVDVANATLMAIEGGERFGLAQLHQLRGRIGRGDHPGFCCVFSDSTTDDARERLEAFAATTDGFELAEKDFQLRGPGDLFGTRQHGLPPLMVANLQSDASLLEETRCDAATLVATHPNLAGDEWARLRKMVFARYGKALELGDVG